ncbi:MAG: ATP-binding protein [Candidatus Methanofastidiosia archaeon]|jgi:hypothetical protein
MISKDIGQITEEDLQALIDNSVIERKNIEYKQELHISKDSEKKEFLADVSSFANASGGDLIYGIIEDTNTGAPKTLKGLNIKNVDREIARMDNMIRNGIEPRIPSYNIEPVTLSNSRKAIVIRIHKSWISPHRVTFKGHDKFYSRSSNGKYPLDVAELRIAFNLSETIIEIIRKFREDRISNIFANETPIPLYEGGKIVLHLVPIVSFDPARRCNIDEIDPYDNRMRPIYSGSRKSRYNLDGILNYSIDSEGKTSSYVQLFRNGIIEAVEGRLLMDREEPIIPSVAYEEELIRSLPQYLALLKSLSVELPIFIFLTLVNVEGYKMATYRWKQIFEDVCPIDRDILILPEVIIEKYDSKAEDILKPCFDSIWNACGFPKSWNYNEDGKWSPVYRGRNYFKICRS